MLVTADRGYWDTTIEADLTTAGITTVVIPRTGKPSRARAAIEHGDTFIAAVKWRTGCEGRISHLNATGPGAAPDSAATTALAPGAPTASSHTTSSRSTNSDNDPQPNTGKARVTRIVGSTRSSVGSGLEFERFGECAM